ncbi:hypothetical protein Fmac_031748 [Flemingia macrophylla]|uniref:Uncharacterized protein n=1 Tax=Flemingia macrophylla TaxID=520843 RepID=A0ABD1L2X9_9FABA
MEFACSEASAWKEALSAYASRIHSLSVNKKKGNLVALDEFYRNELPSLLQGRNPSPFVTRRELSDLMQWKLTRGKWRPRLLNLVSSLDDALVSSASQKAFQNLPDLSKAVSALTLLKGVGPATASALLAAFAPHIAPFMSDEAMEAALGNSKDYSLKQYLKFAEKLQMKAKELSSGGESFTPSDVERALWSSAMGQKQLSAPQENQDPKTKPNKSSKRKRKN